ncbi:TerC family protein [Naumannella halotolerans]|uniref:Tellurite resistance protein TerC n=1 Tax=Naumannella halotolerans TaxID=993414 RepID=A0A4R7J7Q8_9ACTN|nr:TerC family protein [Naumannella halotolerans]TDT33492.1 tellurite resistance protein TerC [Naumannella halotolerans]
MAFANSFAPLWVIGLVVGVTIVVLIFDVMVLGRRPHVPSNKETGIALGVYISAALLFGVYVWFAGSSQLAVEYYAGWLTEYSLSIDNLFVFIIIMTKLGVPRKYQQFALLVGIVIALVLRAIFILVGAQAINQWSWVFYLFGAFLIYTAVKLAMENIGGHDDDEDEVPAVVSFVQKRLPFTESWDHGTKLRVVENGKKVFTPMMIVIIALGLTDLLFALDSIPAIFGLTQDPFLVLMANIFALMGLRQLYFLIGGLLQKLVYLGIGLSVLLAFIGVKLIFHAMHLNELPFINGGEHIEWAPDIPISVSLGVIIGILTITTIASLIKSRSDARKEAAAGGSGATAGTTDRNDDGAGWPTMTDDDRTEGTHHAGGTHPNDHEDR